jgi:peptidoglycan hydrolase-like protein with peptidoglycan-binding domain
MKKITIVLFIVLVALGAWTGTSQAQTTSSPNVNEFLAQLQILRQLRQGMSGEDVKMLQEILATQPDIYPEGLVTGYYGALTSKAVKKYQEKFGIAPVGEVGPLTRKKINEILAFSVNATSTATSTAKGVKADCIKVPPGHLIAPGWLKKNGGAVPEVSTCMPLPPGIAKKLGRNASTTPPVLDVTAPVISQFVATSTTATTSILMWNTNEAASTKLVYGTSSPVLSSSATSSPKIVSGFSLAHEVALTNLATSTTYYAVALSADMAGNVATSSQISFTTGQ